MSTRKHGCYDREPFDTLVTVQDGYMQVVDEGKGWLSRTERVREVPNPNTKDCQYSRSIKTHKDPACAGCKWHQPTPDHP